jgi:hypothetical protein
MTGNNALLLYVYQLSRSSWPDFQRVLAFWAVKMKASVLPFPENVHIRPVHI